MDFLFLILGLILFLILVIELGFRMAYRRKIGRSWIMIPKIPFRDLYVEPHPYLPFVYKRNFTVRNEMPALYPLNADKGFSFGIYRTNSMRFMNGPGGEREVVVPKPENMIRINCLGASVGALYLRHQGRDFSYPMELEDILRRRCPGRIIEVNNFSAGLRTTAEIFIDFALNVIETQPDIVILYHGYNDLAPSLTPGFLPDYSHARKNLGETYFRFRIASMLPDLPLASYNYLLSTVLGGNVRFSLTRSITRQEMDPQSDFQGFPTYRRNIEYIIYLCRMRGIAVILSTFCHYLHEGIRDDPKEVKLHEGVLRENAILRELAEKHHIPLVDSFNLIPAEDRYFVDNIHFSPEGMSLLAEGMSVPVIDILEKPANRREGS